MRATVETTHSPGPAAKKGTALGSINNDNLYENTHRVLCVMCLFCVLHVLCLRELRACMCLDERTFGVQTRVRLGGVLITDKPISLCVVFLFSSFLGEGRREQMIRGDGSEEGARKRVPFFFVRREAGPRRRTDTASQTGKES